MDSDELELPEYDGRDDRLDQARRWPLVWPWLVLLGLLAIGYGIVGPFVAG